MIALSAVSTSRRTENGWPPDAIAVLKCIPFKQEKSFCNSSLPPPSLLFPLPPSAYPQRLFSSFADENVKPNDLYYRSVCFSPDGKYLAGGAEDKTIKIWNIEKKQMANILTGHELDIYSVDFSSDGKTLVSGSGDKKAKIWNIEKGKVVLLSPFLM